MKKSRFYYGSEERYAIVRILSNPHDEEDCKTEVMNSSKHPRKNTICGVWDTEKNTLSFGVSVCSSKDRFEKRIGREFSEKRALENPILVLSVTEETVSDTFNETVKKLDKEMIERTHFHNIF